MFYCSQGGECAIKSNYIDFHANETTFMKMSTENSTNIIEVAAPLVLDSVFVDSIVQMDQLTIELEALRTGIQNAKTLCRILH